MTEESHRPRRLPEGRRAVLYAVRRRGEATAEQVAEQLGMTREWRAPTPQRARRRRLRGGNRAAATARKRGRRALVYSVTAAADALFPKAYGELTNELLGLCGRRRTAAMLDARCSPPPRAIALRGAPSTVGGQARTWRAKVVELTRILDEDGYLASSERHRCRACTASSSTTARSGRSPNATDRRARVSSTSSAPRSMDADVERVQHMVAGARRCAYEVPCPERRPERVTRLDHARRIRRHR